MTSVEQQQQQQMPTSKKGRYIKIKTTAYCPIGCPAHPPQTEENVTLLAHFFNNGNTFGALLNNITFKFDQFSNSYDQDISQQQPQR